MPQGSLKALRAWLLGALAFILSGSTFDRGHAFTRTLQRLIVRPALHEADFMLLSCCCIWNWMENNDMDPFGA